MTQPYAVPDRLSPDLVRVLAYWRGLLRGAAEMPFWDDVRLADLPDLGQRLLLIDVFGPPERFRFDTLGAELAANDFAGRFLDEAQLPPLLAFLRSQCSATVEAAEPTYFHAQERDGAPAFGRLLLPMWGDGRIRMLLGAVDLERAARLLPSTAESANDMPGRATGPIPATAAARPSSSKRTTR